MPVKPILRLKREYTFDISDVTSVTFYFKVTEDLDLSGLRKLISIDKNRLKKLSVDNSDNKSDNKSIESINDLEDTDKYNYAENYLRQCLVDWKGFDDENGNPFPVRDKNGEIIVECQKIVWDWIRSYKPERPIDLPPEELFDDATLLEKILIAFGGETGKNSKTG